MDNCFEQNEEAVAAITESIEDFHHSKFGRFFEKSQLRQRQFHYYFNMLMIEEDPDCKRRSNIGLMRAFVLNKDLISFDKS